jgi:hypothetical protein
MADPAKPRQFEEMAGIEEQQGGCESPGETVRAYGAGVTRHGDVVSERDASDARVASGSLVREYD